VVIEAARILSRHPFPATIVYGVPRARSRVCTAARCSPSMRRRRAGGSRPISTTTSWAPFAGRTVSSTTRLRLFPKARATPKPPRKPNSGVFEGGENDSASRNVARYAKAVAESYMPNWTVRWCTASTASAAAGDHSAFNALGFPAVRFTENAENYRHQHQDVRNEGGVEFGDTLANVDFAYLAKVTATNALAAASMASAPPPPVKVKIAGAVTPDTQLSWTASPGVPAAGYRVHWRDTSETGLDACARRRHERQADASRMSRSMLRIRRRQRFRGWLREPGGLFRAAVGAFWAQ